jgi:HEAT repeat protein
VRFYAVIALGYIGPDAKDTIPALIKSLKDLDPSIRSVTFDALARVGKGSGGAVVPVLVEGLKSEDSKERLRAARAVEMLGPEAKAATPQLAEMLNARDAESRLIATYALGAIGPEAKEAVPALLRLQNDRFEQNRVQAVVALLKIAPESEMQITPALLKQVKTQIEEEKRTGGRRIGPGRGSGSADSKWVESYGHMLRGNKLYE